MPNSFSGGAQNANGARILALERWYTTGWDAIPSSTPTTANDKNSLVLALEGNLTAGLLDLHLHINGIDYRAEDHLYPAQFGNSPNGVARYGTGTGATPFTLIRYGGSGSNSVSDPDTDFATGFDSDGKKTITVMFSE